MDLKYEYSRLETKHEGFRVPTYEIFIGKNSTKSLDISKMKVSSITVTETAINDEIGNCEIVLSDAFDLETKKVDKYLTDNFVENKHIKILLGYVERTLVFYGTIESVDINFSVKSDEGYGITMVVIGRDAKAVLQKGKENSAINNDKTKAVVEKSLKECSDCDAVLDIKVGKLMDFDTSLRQNAETSFDFLKKIAYFTQSNFFVRAGIMYFDNFLSKADINISLKYGESLMSFSRKISLDKQLASFEIKSINRINNKPVSFIAEKIDMAGKGKWAGEIYSDRIKADEKLDLPIVEEKETAEKIAIAALTWRAMGLVTCNGKCIGLPEIQVGRWMEVDGMTNEVNGEYFICEVTHTYDKDGFVTEFVLKGARIPE